MEYVYLLRQAIVYLITVFWIYELTISLCSLIKFKDKPLLKDKKHKFMAIIPAHNEENVIGNLVESLKCQDYDENLYDIYVIADNCTDNTAKIAKEAGAIVYKRFDETKKTKGYALDWFLKQKIQENADYDAFLIFDADNIVDKNFIKVMNRKLCQGEEVVQGYKDIKNPESSWISAGYAFFYWTMHRFYHLARYNIGLSPLLNGTGFMVKFDIIKKNGGWDTVTLTEDIEFSLKQIIKGEKLGWASDAIVYDEQPEKFVASWKQRSRWTVGHIQCTKIYTKDLAVAVKNNKTIMNFDGFLYIMGAIPMFIVSMLLVLSNFVIYLFDSMSTLDLIMNILKYIVPTFFLPIGTALITMYLDKKPIKPMLKWTLYYPLFMGTWLLINAKCLIKQDITWEKIDHVRSVKIKEIA